MAFWHFKPTETQTFSDLIRGLQHSISSAMEMVEARNLEILNRYFNPKTGEAVKKQIVLDDESVLDIPLISVVNPSTLNVKEVEMEFTLHINQSELKQKASSSELYNNDTGALYADRIERSSLNVSFAGGKDQSKMNVKIRFESSPITEGMSRIVTEFDKTIVPKIKGE